MSATWTGARVGVAVAAVMALAGGAAAQPAAELGPQAALTAMGHQIAWSGRQGIAHCIFVGEGGVLVGVPDARDSDGTAAGY